MGKANKPKKRTYKKPIIIYICFMLACLVAIVIVIASSSSGEKPSNESNLVEDTTDNDNDDEGKDKDDATIGDSNGNQSDNSNSLITSDSNSSKQEDEDMTTTKSDPENEKKTSKKIFTDSQWLGLKSKVFNLAQEKNFSEASLLIYNELKDVERDSLSFLEEIEKVEQNIAFLDLLKDRSVNGMLEFKEAVEIAKVMQSPQLALIAFFTLTHEERVYTILHQSSLVPFTDEDSIPEHSSFEEYSGEFENMIRSTYGQDTTILSTEVTISDSPVSIILIETVEGLWNVWRIIEVEDTPTHFQNVDYWKNYFKATKK